jgi:hypothetical protein
MTPDLFAEVPAGFNIRSGGGIGLNGYTRSNLGRILIMPHPLLERRIQRPGKRSGEPIHQGSRSA